MDTRKYLDPKDWPTLRETIRIMLAAGTARSDIVTFLAADYVPVEDLAKFVAQTSTMDDARRYRPARILLMATAAACMVLTMLIMALLILMPILTHSTQAIGRLILSCGFLAIFLFMPMLLLSHLRHDSGLAYPFGFLTGIVFLCGSLPDLSKGALACAIGAAYALSGLIMLVTSWFVWRRFFPDVRLFSAPTQDGMGAYVFRRDKQTN